ncbi:hypothetical protein [Paenibacillus sp. N3.4]|uniref:hypothetical protein n=1 Tax=Paenibacillus sp. N3.4 TaxID=2603222 RepID=UPI0021C30065|nr:hypothetical protein [Paenibacillus sp. N3.4]
MTNKGLRAKGLTVFIFLLVFLVALTGCSSSSQPAPSSTAAAKNSASPAAASTAKADEPVTIEYWQYTFPAKWIW